MENRIAVKDPEQGILKGILYKNPVLIRMIGIGPVVGAAVTLKNGIAICIIMTVLFLATGLCSYGLGYRLPDWAKTPTYVALSAVAVIPAFLICGRLLPGTVAALGVFGPIMIVNSIIISRTGHYGTDSLSETVNDIVGNVIGFSVVVLILSAFRELLSYGTILDIPVENITKIRAMGLPFAGYIMLGFSAAVLRKLRGYVRDKRKERIIDE